MKPTEHVFIRSGAEADLGDLVVIYNHYVVHTAVTFDVEPVTVEKRRATWFAEPRAAAHQLVVAEVGGRAVGYASSERFREKPAYASSVGLSIYLHPGQVGRGLGRALYDELFRRLAACPHLHRAYALITLPNVASLALHRSFGFRDLGVMNEVGCKFGAYHSVALLEKNLPPAAPTPSA